MWKDAVISIHICPEAAGEMVGVRQARAVQGQGLEGDRYFGDTRGTFSREPDPAHQVTLIESEALEALERDYRYALAPGASRRNVMTRGVPLNHLVGREFRVGTVRLKGLRLAEPCSHLARLTSENVRKGLIHRGGLRCEILESGVLQVGDALELL